MDCTACLDHMGGRTHNILNNFKFTYVSELSSFILMHLQLSKAEFKS